MTGDKSFEDWGCVFTVVRAEGDRSGLCTAPQGRFMTPGESCRRKSDYILDSEVMVCIGVV